MASDDAVDAEGSRINEYNIVARPHKDNDAMIRELSSLERAAIERAKRVDATELQLEMSVNDSFALANVMKDMSGGRCETRNTGIRRWVRNTEYGNTEGVETRNTGIRRAANTEYDNTQAYTTHILCAHDFAKTKGCVCACRRREVGCGCGG
jgi:hypothetical protein